MAREAHRLRFQDELRQLEEQALGALDMVVTAMDRTLEALEHLLLERAQLVLEAQAVGFAGHQPNLPVT